MSSPRRFIHHWARRATLLPALRLAAFVGTVLNTINQGAAIMDGQAPSWPHLVLNYVVPFCVASYTVTRQRMLIDAACRS